MNKQQLAVLASGLIILLSLYFFGRTKPLAGKTPIQATAHPTEALSSDEILATAKAKLSPERQAWIDAKQNSIIRGDLNTQRIHLYDELATFWRDTVQMLEPYIYYLGEKSKLENSEKSLTFAAHYYLRQIKGVEQHALQVWMANQAADLFKKALELNPENDSSKIGLGSSYMYGAQGAANPMEGTLKIIEVVNRDSTNIYGQFMLGYGGIITGQFAKAAERLKKVVDVQPNNLEAIFLLAEAYERSGEKAAAVNIYEKGKALVQNPAMIEEIEKRITDLKH